MEKVRVEMPEAILANPNNWYWEDTSYYMSHHMYRGTSMEAFETISTCGNCDGSRCDGCEKKEIPAHWNLSIPSDELYEALVNAGVDESAASDLAYDDMPSKTHSLNWDYRPSKEMLKTLEELHGTKS